MIYTNKFFNILLSVLSILIGIKMIYTKTIKQGNSSMRGGEVFIGDFAYVIGSIFILFGFYALYSILTKKA